MNSNEDPLIIGDNQFQLLVNVYHDGSKIRKRPPHKRIHNGAATATGIFPPIGCGVFRTTASTWVVWGTSQGKMWRLRSTGASLAEMTLTSANALTTGNRANFVQYFNLMYAADQVRLLEFDPSAATTTTNIFSIMAAPSNTGITAPYFLAYWQFRLWVADRAGRIAASEQEADVSDSGTDPWQFSGSGFTGFVNPVASGDGAQISGMAVNNTALVISKMSSIATEYLGKTLKVTGTSQADFAVKEISPVIGYLGTSGQSIGSKLLGLTHSGFQYLNTVEEEGTTTTAGALNTEKIVSGFQRNVIPDFIKDKLKDLNITYAEQVAGIYDPRNHCYYCSFPFGDSTYNSLTVRIDLSNNDIRMSLFTNTDAQYFFYMNGFVHFIDRRGSIWKMMDHDETTYEEESYTAIIMSKRFPMKDSREFGNVREFVPEIETFDDNKTLKIFQHTYTTDTASREIVRSTDRQGIYTTTGDYALIEKLAFYPNRWNNLVFDMDDLDRQRFRTFRPSLQTNLNCNYSEFMIIDQQTDTDGSHDFTYHGYTVKGSTLGEAI